MSLAQVSPSRAFSPFRFSIKKSSASDPLKKLDPIARSFDENLLRRLKILTPVSDSTQISISWLSHAVDFLSFTHAEAHTLISSLKLSAPDGSLVRYLDESVKLLDICNSISSEIERLRQRRLMINFALHLIEAADVDHDAPAPEKLRRSRECLEDWEKQISGDSRGFSNLRSFEKSAEVLIRDLAADLGRAPRGKLSAVSKLVRRTFYAVGLVTVFVSGAFASALCGSDEIVSVKAPSEFLWADAFNSLESTVHAELTRRVGQSVKLQEIVDADSRVRGLLGVITDMEGGDDRRSALGDAVRDLQTAMKAFSEGLDGLCNGVNGMFQRVLCNRNGMLGSFVHVEKQHQKV